MMGERNERMMLQNEIYRELSEIIVDIASLREPREGCLLPDIRFALAYEIRRLKALLDSEKPKNIVDGWICIQCMNRITTEPVWHVYFPDNDKMGPFCSEACRAYAVTLRCTNEKIRVEADAKKTETLECGYCGEPYPSGLTWCQAWRIDFCSEKCRSDNEALKRTNERIRI
jgi:hypothetical protein